MLDPASGIGVALPDDDDLIGDLTSPRLARVTSNSRMVVEDKESVRKRIGRSTDAGDAVIQVLVGPHLHRELVNETMGDVTYRPVKLGPDF